MRTNNNVFDHGGVGSKRNGEWWEIIPFLAMSIAFCFSALSTNPVQRAITLSLPLQWIIDLPLLSWKRCRSLVHSFNRSSLNWCFSQLVIYLLQVYVLLERTISRQNQLLSKWCSAAVSVADLIVHDPRTVRCLLFLHFSPVHHSMLIFRVSQN